MGKTSTVTALGDAIAGFDKKVLLVDANFSAPNLGLHLNVVNPLHGLHDVLRGKINISSAIQEVGNFDLLPSAPFNNFTINVPATV